jgi:serine/threonine protein kinase
MAGLDEWERLRFLGEGAQGQVFLVRTPARRARRQEALAQIRPSIGNIGGHDGESSASIVQRLLEAIEEYNRPERHDELGALKTFAIPASDATEAAQVQARLAAEITILQKVAHPAVLKLLAANSQERFIVTEFHGQGTLALHLQRYQGRALTALKAFRPLVDAVRVIHHEQGAIHRDIKPENIFVADDNRLVLGDFGIVFVSDVDRQTTTHERMGSHYWMAAFAYKQDRLPPEQITPALDIYPLAKTLWSMIAGRNGFPFWEWDRPENNLEALFPHDPLVAMINQQVIAKCIVREERDCIGSAPRLLTVVDELIAAGTSLGERPTGAVRWRCRMCQEGSYERVPTLLLAQMPGRGLDNQNTLAIYVCNNPSCGHAELFKDAMQLPNA